jgi:hypothetical protein
MAILYIEEYSALGRSISGVPLQAPGALIASHTRTISGTSAQSAALNAATKWVVLTTDLACAWREGASPTAVATDRFLPANTPRAFQATPGFKIAAITV